MHLIYSITVWADFHSLQDRANFWQTDLFWHGKHHSVIIILFSLICTSFSRNNTCKKTQFSKRYLKKWIFWRWMFNWRKCKRFLLACFFQIDLLVLEDVEKQTVKNWTKEISVIIWIIKKQKGFFVFCSTKQVFVLALFLKAQINKNNQGMMFFMSNKSVYQILA